MEKFISKEIIVSGIDFCIFVQPGAGLNAIKNRRAHGFIYNCKNPKKYIFSDGTEIDSKPGDVIFAPKNSTYKMEMERSGDSYVINFHTAEELKVSPFIFTSKNLLDIMKHFDNAENIWRAKRMGYYEKCMAELYSIIHMIKKEATSYSPKNARELIEPALLYIHESFCSENISIEKLASLCGISEQYLRRIFMVSYGVSPLKYINNLKMLRARELIKSGNYSMSEVAELSGFFDYSYFSREFKKSAGVSPVEYMGSKL